MSKLTFGSVGVLLLACATHTEPSVPPVAPVVAPLPSPTPGRSAEDAELEAEIGAGLDSEEPADAPTAPLVDGAAGSAP